MVRLMGDPDRVLSHGHKNQEFKSIPYLFHNKMGVYASKITENSDDKMDFSLSKQS